MSLHTWRCQGPHKPSSCTSFGLNSPWGRAATGKKNLPSMRAGSLRSHPALCGPVDCGLPGFSVRGVLQARILECIFQYWLPDPSRALYFLLPQLPTPLSTWCCQNPCDLSHFENDYTTKCNLQIQCDPYQMTNDIFHRTRTKNLTIHMETQKTPNSQSSLEKEEWSWRNQPS